MRKLMALAIIVASSFGLLFAKPMEALSRYNVVLVHGAAPENQGFESTCDETVRSAWDFHNNWVVDYTTQDGKREAPKSLGDAAGMLGAYNQDGEKKLTLWLDSAVFEDTVTYGSEYIYIQRSFANPAASPAHNAHEIGDRTWKGNNNCSVRRALFEEAQEVRAEGSTNLEKKRNDGKLSYRTIPSRNILIAHSMGGVASHEYVTDTNVYNNDVDKVITLDSPHEGTGSLNLLIDMRDYGQQISEASWQYMEILSLGLVLASTSTEPYTTSLALASLLPSFGLSVMNRAVTTIVDKGYLKDTYDFKEEDPLSHYIHQDSAGINDLINRSAIGEIPMMRLLGGYGGITFSDPNRGYKRLLNVFLPEATTIPLMNFYEHTFESDGSEHAKFVNSMTGLSIGFAGGIAVQDVGTTLVPEYSSLATSTPMFNNGSVDVKRWTFNASPTAESVSISTKAIRGAAVVTGVVSGVMAANFIPIPWVAMAAKTAVVVAGATVYALDLADIVGAGVEDIMSSHENAKARRMLDTLYSADFSYTKVGGGNVSGKTRLMEDFLYEKPFVNLALSVVDTALRNVDANCFYEADSSKKERLCEIGLYGANGEMVSKTGRRNYKEFQKSPIAFKSGSDWEKMGMKIDRWERVDGLKPDGSENPGGVPIRHVERYNVPAITVDNWIEKYSFVVDDLMPHRLRQIRMNFNYQEEIAWECDVTKDPDANDACSVFKRSGGGNWKLADSIGNKGYVPHPVKKNGQFDFVPGDYGYNNLLAIQKDNQNTVTISTVNKIGLSNTQRFYYLFKATDNFLVPIWPLRDVVVNSIDGFEAYASVLDYQGFRVAGMRDSFWRVDGEKAVSLGKYCTMDSLREEHGGIDYGSKNESKSTPLSSGEYHWSFNAITFNAANYKAADSGRAAYDSSDVFDVPFVVDLEPPAFRLIPEKSAMNPDSALFMARFKWGRDSLVDENDVPDIRVMRWKLEKFSGVDSAGDSLFKTVAKLPSMYDVAAKDFAVAWDKVPKSVRDTLRDGLYRIAATALDYAVPSKVAYSAMLGLLNKVAAGKDESSDWSFIDNYKFNRSDEFAEFRVDATAPEFKFVAVGGKVIDSNFTQKYALLTNPSKNDDVVRVSKDELLKVDYSVKELLDGRENANVSVFLNFVHYDNPHAIDRAGDSVEVFAMDSLGNATGNVAYGTWTETEGMQLADGRYAIRVIVRDEAGNADTCDYGKEIRIDRTAPQVVSLVSLERVYPEGAGEYKATVKFDQEKDIPVNRTGMHCHFRVNGADANGTWYPVSKTLLKSGELAFEIASEAVGLKKGKRYLTVACLDSANNVGLRTDLFHVGVRYPQIVSPVGDDDFISATEIPIVGIAPPPDVKYENTTVYRLLYSVGDTLHWESSDIFVSAANRSQDNANVSRTAQSSDGILGYLHNGFHEETKVFVKLEVRACESCDWISDSTSVTEMTLVQPEEDDGLPRMKFELSRTSVEVGSDSLEIGLSLDGEYSGSYQMRLYAEDSKGKGLFDKSASAIYNNPYLGSPADTNQAKGVWFYEKDARYHLVWKGLLDEDSIRVSYNSASLAGTCLLENGGRMPDADCRVVHEVGNDLPFISATNKEVSDFPEWKFPDNIDSAMILSGANGHVVIETKKAIRVSGSSRLLTGESSMPVYFGSYSEDGFAFMWKNVPEIADVVTPWQIGWVANRASYGLKYTWNGMGSVNDFPAAGAAKVYAEIVSNFGGSAHAILRDTVIDLSLKPMELEIADIPEFYLVDNSSAVVEKDGEDEPIYDLGSLNIPFSLLYRDAYVSAVVLDSAGEVVGTLLDSAFRRASPRRFVHSVVWNPVDLDGHPVNPGNYTVQIVAYENGGDYAIEKKIAEFKVSMKRMVPSEDDRLLYIAEAEDDNGKNRYVPFADFLVKADLRAKYLPVEKRSGVTLDVDASGTQEIYGFEPKRFSLAIKRHKKVLNLVAITHFYAKLDEINGWVTTPCSENETHDVVDAYDTFFLDFDEDGGKTQSVDFDKTYENRGFNGRGGPDDGFADVVVFTLKDYNKFLRDNSIGVVSSAEMYSRAKSAATWKLMDMLQTVSKDSVFRIPGTKSNEFKYPLEFDDNMGCKVEMDDDYISKSCTYGDSGTTADYNPNKNLLEVAFVPGDDSLFYTDKGAINDHCEEVKWQRYKKAKFRIRFTVPDPYWNAPFGMDNLVNRTVRFDHTNKTIYGNGDDGYWPALIQQFGESADVGSGSYYDGTQWAWDPSYGLLTPFEMQYLPFLPAEVLSGGLNTFLFADENESFMYPSYFDMKFYGPENYDDYFQVLALGYPVESMDGCDYSPETNYEVAFATAMGELKNSRCQVSLTSLQDSVRTPLFHHGNVSFYVGRNTKRGVGKTVSIPFPVKADEWREKIGKEGQACDGAVDYENGKASCYKYYNGGSNVHYYFADYANENWMKIFTIDGEIIKNPVNSPANTFPADGLDFVDPVLANSGIGNVLSSFKVKPDNKNYEDGFFYIDMDTIAKLKNDKELGNITLTKFDVVLSDPLYGKPNEDFTRLNVPASDFVKEGVVYRHKDDDVNRAPTMMESTQLPLQYFSKKLDSWMKEPSLENVSLLHLDSTEHSHFKAETAGTDLSLSFKDASDIKVVRPKEFVEIKGNLKAGESYQLSYFKDGVYYFIGNYVATVSGPQHITWFDVNRLQGNTQFLLTWGVPNSSSDLYYARYNLYVGSPIKESAVTTVSSLLGELDVTFPEGALEAGTEVTVRTSDMEDYPFEVFNGTVLTGPVMEVLPKHDFGDGPYPRVQMVISKDEMEARGVTPSTLKLYKVDFDNRQFVALTDALYGFLDKDGAPVLGADGEILECRGAPSDDSRCSDENLDWSYIQISAETKTFSVFAAMDSRLADAPRIGLEIIPEIAASSERLVNVKSASLFDLYVDDDSLWNDREDRTPAVKLPYSMDDDGLARVSLPLRAGEIDTNYVFAVAKMRDDSGNVVDLPQSPAVARVLTVPAEFACEVPPDSLWLGLDNGYLAYAAGCSHPGYGLVSLYGDGRPVVELRVENPDTLIYDGARVVGGTSVGKIAPGVYESRYLGVSSLGKELQMAGPDVHTDSARPAIENFDVQETADVLDRVFRVTARVTDGESGIAKVVVVPVFGADTLKVLNIVPDAEGNVSGDVRLTRKRLGDCSGCKLSLSLRAEDHGHNHSSREYLTGALFPYPAELALWYPAYEGAGETAHEFVGTGHDMSLRDVSSPWQSDAGLYFGNLADRAVGEGYVNLDASTAYTFEARIKRGYSDAHWRRILGFRGTGGLNIELQSLGRTLRLVEGDEAWYSGVILPEEKTWTHVAVTLDSMEVHFYVDGNLSKTVDVSGSEFAGIEREFYGTFSMGNSGKETDDVYSYIGNVADIRMYTGALTAEQVAAISSPVTDDGDDVDIAVAAVGDIDVLEGFERLFSCSVPGNRIYSSSANHAKVRVTVPIENDGVYNVVLYARSASLNSAKVSAGESTSLQSGTVRLSSVWRAVSVSGVALGLTRGSHAVVLEMPAGVQLGGVAFTSGDIAASSIPWGRNVASSAQSVQRKVAAYLRYEGYPETSTLRPRIRLKNISDEQVNGYSVRYYFRGEDPTQVSASPYHPQKGFGSPSIHAESATLGYAEWKFPNASIPAGGYAFDGQGPHFGLNNADWTPWDATDDPSFVDVAAGVPGVTADGFAENMGIVVLDGDDNLIGGSCVEMEDDIAPVVKASVLAADVRDDAQASEIHVKVENSGNVPLGNFDVRYYFFMPGGLTPKLDVNYISACESVSLESLGSGRWQVNVHCAKSLAAGRSWNDYVNFAIHEAEWQPVWDASDDPGHAGLGRLSAAGQWNLVETQAVCVYDSLGNRIYGQSPAWPSATNVAAGPDEPPYVADFGYKSPDNGIPVVRTEDGLVLTLDNYTNLSLKLVNVIGVPLRSLYSGTLAPGEQMVRVDWAGVDLKTTFLELRVNGSIVATKLLYLL